MVWVVHYICERKARLEPTCLCPQILQSRPQAFVGFAYGQTSVFSFFLADLANWTCLFLCISSSFAYMQFTCFECGMNFQTACILGSDAVDWNYAGVWSESLGTGLCVCGLHANDEAVVPSVGERGKRSNTAHVGDVTQERLCSRRNTISHFPFRITDVRKHIIIQTKGAVLQTLLKTIETITEIQMVTIINH